MIRTFLIPLLAIAGMIMAAYTVVQGARPPMPQPPIIEPPQSPYEIFVAGSGLIEASSQNIEVGSPVSAVVTKVLVTVGDMVEADAPLFELENVQERAELEVRMANLNVMRERLAKLEAGTRPEQIPPARAIVDQVRAELADATAQYEKFEKVNDTRAVSADDLSRRKFAVEAAKARLAQASSDLALLEAGTWTYDLAVARSELQQVASQVKQAQVEVERRIVRSPVSGRVLQVNIRKGEFSQAGTNTRPLMLVGTVNPLHVRIDIDEHEAWRVKPGATATAFIKGNKDITFPLTFVRYEPYVLPKRSLTGDTQERVDTRVLQVIYAFDPKGQNIFVGQQVDVYISSDVTHTPPPAPAPAAVPAS
jgi:HlyD family secretion protein